MDSKFMIKKKWHWIANLIKQNWLLIVGLIILIVVFVFARNIVNWDIDRKYYLNASFLKVVMGTTLVFLIVSLYLQYKIRDDMHSGLDVRNEKSKKKRVLHHHYTYSHIGIFTITVTAVLFAAYSDVFNQQGDPIEPIINGLNNNITKFELESLNFAEDTTKLVLIIDVSGSMKDTNDDFTGKWIISAKDKIVSYNNWKSASTIRTLLSNINTSNTHDLVKLKICDLLISKRDNLIKEKKVYFVSLLVFGMDGYRHSRIRIQFSQRYIV
ncbi:hypothetical protein N9164_12105 [Draconibacterium sp.]|nr:hypothetical protein [Draconibacterium sp.]